MRKNLIVLFDLEYAKAIQAELNLRGIATEIETKAGRYGHTHTIWQIRG